MNHPSRDIDVPSRALFDALTQGATPIESMTPEQARAAGGKAEDFYGVGPEMSSVHNLVLDGRDGGQFVVRVLVPHGSLEAAVVYYHGGGWVLSSIDDFDTLGRKLAVVARSVVVLVDYRKAPEAPFPIPVEDAWSAFTWAEDNLSELVGSELPLMVAGDSAGGNLAAVVGSRAGAKRVSLCVLVYPVLDLTMDSPSYRDPTNAYLLSPARMAWFAEHYLGDNDPTDPEASPSHLPTLEGYPATAIYLARRDPLFDEGIMFSRRLQGVGSLADIEVFADQYHGFFQFVNHLPASEVALARIGTRIHDHVLSTVDGGRA